MNYRVVFIDVDDTLVRSVGSKRIPNPPLIKKVRALHAEGVILYLWSTGGAEYAKMSAVELGIEAHASRAFYQSHRFILMTNQFMSGETVRM